MEDSQFLTIFCGVIFIFFNQVECLTVRQISTSSDRASSYAVDGDPSTCAETGWHWRPWWQINVPETTVDNIYVKLFFVADNRGINRANVTRMRLRVGSKTDLEGDDQPINPPCATWLGPFPNELDEVIPCESPIVGGTMTVEAIADGYMKLGVCEFKYNV